MYNTTSFLFVYGTLLQPRNEFAAYLNMHCELISTGKIKGQLYDAGDYPGAVMDTTANGYVYGNIYIMQNPETTLIVLDNYEGFGDNQPQPNEFIRLSKTIETDGEPFECWVYIYNLPVDGLVHIPAGNYLEYKNGL